MSKVAIYARKSVFREDSISIESQIEMCEYEARGEEYSVYKDNGFSGKNTERPDFQRMMKDIKSGLINKVIVYKLDRVSRSVLDFSEMMEIFQKYNVAFVSATEHFDTSSPMGRAMLNICIVFAQLERETIQQRVIDAYASRSKKGFYMGGKVPFGYKKEPYMLDGIKTSIYVEEPREADIIRLIYDLYSEPSVTLGQVSAELEKRGLQNSKRGHTWCAARISEIMRNPAYTFNDRNIYDFFKEQGSNMVNSIEEYTGENSVYLFKGENKNRKTWDLSGHNVVIAPHKGIVDSETWIYCRKKLLGNHQVKTCKPKNSFLSGKIKCGHCGYSIVVRYSARNRGSIRYFIDTGKSEYHVCKTKLPVMRSDAFEDAILEKITTKINTLTVKPKENGIEDELQKQIEIAEIEMKEIERSIALLIDTITNGDADKVTMGYINQKVRELDNKKKSLVDEVNRLLEEKESRHNGDYDVLVGVMSVWDTLSFDDKRNVIELLIEKILVYSDRIEIIWKV